MLSRALTILLLCLAATFPAWQPVADAQPPSLASGATQADCGCGGLCGMSCCGCALAPEAPQPEPWAPAQREAKPLTMGLALPDPGLVLPRADRPMPSPIAGVRPASFSYDSIQSYLCIWRS